VGLGGVGVLGVGGAGRPDGEQVVGGGAGGVREFADAGGVLVGQVGGIGRAVVDAGEGRQHLGAYGHEGHPVPLALAVVVPAEAPGPVARVAHVGGAEGGVRLPLGELDVGAEAGVGLVVIALADEG